jgi:hypothetical protein
MIVRHGRVVYQYGDVQAVSYIASCRKGVLSMLYGTYVKSGVIRLDRTLKEIGMSDIGGLLPMEEGAKVEDLISARSGVFHPASNPGDMTESAPKRGSYKPGSYWLYNNWDFNAAGAAFERMTGKNIYDALRDDLAVPIGMQDYQRNRQHKTGDLSRSQYPAYHLWLSTRDMARLGYLMLRHGRWLDRQLIPADWVKRTTSLVTPRKQLNPAWLREGPFGYGYLWWVWDHAAGPLKGAYTGWGQAGQFITVLPKLDMVIAHKTLPSMNHEVTVVDYLRLLDRITGEPTASEEILPVLRCKGAAAALDLGRKFQKRPKNRIADESDLYASGVALFRKGQIRESEQVLRLNAKLYSSARTLIALSLALKAEGERAEALESLRKALAMQPKNGDAKIQLARFGASVDGHVPIVLSLDKLRPLTGDYRSKDARYVVQLLDGHLLIQKFVEGEIYDEFEAFAEDDRRFFAPADGAMFRFDMGDKGEIETMTGTKGDDSWRATRG